MTSSGQPRAGGAGTPIIAVRASRLAAEVPGWRRTGQAVTVRLFSPADVRLVEAMSADLSLQSLYQRFFAGTPRIPRATIRQLTTIDHDRHEALLALHAGRAVGLAQYVRDLPGTGAELAVLIADRWQRHGIGRLLVTQLADMAARQGISCFTAHVLPGNQPAIRAVVASWPSVPAVQDSACYRYELPLAAPGRPTQHPAARHWQQSRPGQPGA